MAGVDSAGLLGLHLCARVWSFRFFFLLEDSLEGCAVVCVRIVVSMSWCACGTKVLGCDVITETLLSCACSIYG